MASTQTPESRSKASPYSTTTPGSSRLRTRQSWSRETTSSPNRNGIIEDDLQLSLQDTSALRIEGQLRWMVDELTRLKGDMKARMDMLDLRLSQISHDEPISSLAFEESVSKMDQLRVSNVEASIPSISTGHSSITPYDVRYELARIKTALEQQERIAQTRFTRLNVAMEQLEKRLTIDESLFNLSKQLSQIQKAEHDSAVLEETRRKESLEARLESLESRFMKSIEDNLNSTDQYNRERDEVLSHNRRLEARLDALETQLGLKLELIEEAARRQQQIVDQLYGGSSPSEASNVSVGNIPSSSAEYPSLSGESAPNNGAVANTRPANNTGTNGYAFSLADTRPVLSIPELTSRLRRAERRITQQQEVLNLHHQKIAQFSDRFEPLEKRLSSSFEHQLTQLRDSMLVLVRNTEGELTRIIREQRQKFDNEFAEIKRVHGEKNDQATSAINNLNSQIRAVRKKLADLVQLFNKALSSIDMNEHELSPEIDATPTGETDTLLSNFK